MKKGIHLMVVVLGVTALMVAGCAKEDVVKKDDPVVQQPTYVQPTPPVQTDKGPEIAPVAPDNTVVAPPVESISLDTVYFDFDKSDLGKEARDTLSRNADALLKKLADSKVKIEGHCDERGSDEYNLALGDRRAKSVAKYLTTLGVKADRISTISFGKEKPAVQGNTEASWSKNRRAEFVIVK